ncbi:N-acyl-D-amino-acid deacylase family protein [Sneathiella sp. HT1-7]|uniref:N-acyl-D-amino-acid deacylase family protein n=1 Tax=Sneathiella sp. HT1-7 TaxID=2887192 RepID=UPI001D137CC2|nr:amidohydrolase family protein [Sneathiella sp. HT1-7]MCC3305304.1 amidohydrolase family protein [Sneathiella sp. HT1-7]
MSLDLKITNGTIIDGTGAPGYIGDVGIKDGKIVSVGEVEEDAAREIDATSMVISPGFVDIHTHYDAQVIWDRMLSISPWHGVTTAVIGNCGFGVAPTRPEHRTSIMRTLEKVEGMSFDALAEGLGSDWPFESFAEYMDAIEARGTAINLAVFAGHTPIRTYVMGPEAVERTANDEEVASMADIVREAMEAGAIGFSTSQATTHHGYGGKPVPSRLADMIEMDQLVAAARLGGAKIVQATVGPTLFHDQLALLSQKHDIPVTWTALLSGMSGPGSHRRHQETTRKLREDGVKIHPQVACRPINFDFEFNEPFPFEMRPLFKQIMEADRKGRKAIYRDPEFRDQFRDDTATGARNAVAGWIDRCVISMAPGNPEWEEKPLREIAESQGKDPIDFVLDLSLETDFVARFRFPIVNYDEEEVAELLQDDNLILGLSDAGAHASQLCDACYSTHLLGHWVREKNTLKLEKAIHMLTQKPAELFGITDRGKIAEGALADVVIFDPTTIAAGGLERVHDLPTGADRLISPASGIKTVIVNGQILLEENQVSIPEAAALPGKLLRNGTAA